MQTYKTYNPEIPQERFRMFVSTVISSITQTPNLNRIEQTTYEDFARQISGPEAYLLFVFEKLINQVSTPL